MKNTITIFLIICVTCAFTAAASAAGEPKVVLKTNVLSKRLIPDGAPAGKHPVMTNDLCIYLDNGFYFGTWLWSGLNDARLSSDGTDKWDYYVGWKGKIAEGTTLDLALRYYNLVPFSKAPRGDIIQPHAEICKSLGSLGDHSLSAYLQFDPHYPAKGGKPGKGLLSFLGMRDSWKISGRTRILQDFALVHDDGMCDRDSGLLADYRICLNHKLSEKLELNMIQLRIMTPLSRLSDNRKTEVLWGAGFTYKF